MQQKNNAENFFSDMQSTFKQFMSNAPAGYPFDLKTVMETQRKNMQAIAEANQCAMQGWQALAQRQTEMLSQFVQNNSSLARETFTDGTPETKFAKQADLIKAAVETSIQNSKELSEMCSKCTQDAAEVINQRIVASLSEIKTATKK